MAQNSLRYTNRKKRGKTGVAVEHGGEKVANARRGFGPLAVSLKKWQI